MNIRLMRAALGIGRFRGISSEDLRVLVREILLDPQCEYPVVAVTTHPIYQRCLVDCARLACVLRHEAMVVQIPHGETTRLLGKELTKGLSDKRCNRQRGDGW